MSTTPSSDLPVLIAATFNTQLEAALQEPSLTHAMAYLCICEATRIASSVAGTPLPAFDSHFTYILTQVRDAWIAAHKPLRDFQPRFLPPDPPH